VGATLGASDALTDDRRDAGNGRSKKSASGAWQAATSKTMCRG